MPHPEARLQVHALLDAKQPADAITFAETCTEPAVLVNQILTLACTYPGPSPEP